MLKKSKKVHQLATERLYDETLAMITDKYVLRLVAHLADGKPRRHWELATVFGKIAPATLTRRLRLMEKNGLITRKLYFELPPRVEYRLTSFGKQLVPLAQSILDWTKQYFFYLGGHQTEWERSQTKDQLRE